MTRIALAAVAVCLAGCAAPTRVTWPSDGFMRAADYCYVYLVISNPLPTPVCFKDGKVVSEGAP